jgi:hypothetical protein
MSRPRLDLDDGRPTSADELFAARALIARSELLAALSPLLDSEVGRPRHLSLEGLFVAMLLNARRKNHHALLIDVARVLNAMSDEQRGELGIIKWDPDESYDRVAWLFSRLSRLLEAAPGGIDAAYVANRLARAAIPPELLTSRSIAVDGTDIESWGALQGASRLVELDGDAADTQLIDDQPTPPMKMRRVRTARVFGLGEDGRKRYTKDPEARAGHRSATGQRLAGPYIGYELHLAVQTRDVRWTNFIDNISLGEEVVGVITTCALVPAGTHRGKAIVEQLISASTEFHQIDEVVWDPGYSLCQPETTTYLLARAGIETTLQPVVHQRGIRPFAGEALLLDGQLFSPMLPAELRDLAMPPRGAPAPYRGAFEEAFNRRARWRYVRHSRLDADGVTRWKCPFCAGLLRSRSLPATMRRSRSAPLVALPEGSQSCCHGTLSAPAAELPITQRIPFGTTAWRTSMNRRMVVESANAALKGGFTDLSRGFMRVFGVTKINLLLGFTIAAYNLDRVASYLRKRVAAARKPTRRKRRLGTWSTLLDPVGVASDEAGPPG